VAKHQVTPPVDQHSDPVHPGPHHRGRPALCRIALKVPARTSAACAELHPAEQGHAELETPAAAVAV